MMDETILRVSPGEALAGLSIHPAGDNSIPVFAYMLIRTTTPDGPRWGYRVGGKSVSALELYGAIEAHVELLLQELVVEWLSDEDDENAGDDTAEARAVEAALRQGRRPINETLGGLTVEPLLPESAAEFVFVMIKFRDDGETRWAYRTSAPPDHEELLGALLIETARMKEEAVNQFGSI